MHRYVAPALLFVGCASTPPAATPEHADVDGHADEPVVALDDGVYYDGSGRMLVPRSRTVAVSHGGDRWQTRSLTSSSPARARPAKVGRRNIQLHQARLDNALRMLAKEGGFNLVVNGDLAQPISIDLKNVDPYEALLAIAQANGVAVDYNGNIVIVGDQP
jgi:hypothetical protein